MTESALVNSALVPAYFKREGDNDKECECEGDGVRALSQMD